MSLAHGLDENNSFPVWQTAGYIFNNEKQAITISRRTITMALHNLFGTLQSFTYAGSQAGQYYSLPQLEAHNVGPVSRLPVSIRIVLESVLRNVDGKKVTEGDVRRLSNWKPNEERTAEIP